MRRDGLGADDFAGAASVAAAERLRTAFAWYNCVRIHPTLRVTPVMAAGGPPTVWGVADLLSA